MIPRTSIDHLWDASLQLILEFDHILPGPVKVGGRKVDRVEPKAERKHERVLDIVLDSDLSTHGCVVGHAVAIVTIFSLLSDYTRVKRLRFVHL